MRAPELVTQRNRFSFSPSRQVTGGELTAAGGLRSVPYGPQEGERAGTQASRVRGLVRFFPLHRWTMGCNVKCSANRTCGTRKGGGTLQLSRAGSCGPCVGSPALLSTSPDATFPPAPGSVSRRPLAVTVPMLSRLLSHPGFSMSRSAFWSAQQPPKAPGDQPAPLDPFCP